MTPPAARSTSAPLYPPPRLSRRTTVADVGSWALIAGMAGAAVLRWSGTPPVPLGIGLQAITPWLLSPAFPLAAVAAKRRRPALAAAALAMGVLQVASLWPDVGHFGAQSAPAGSTRLRLVTANLLLDNQDVPGFAADLEALRPDVILLQEITPWNLAELKSTGLFDRFPNELSDPQEGVHGSLVLSRFPLRDGSSFQVAGWPMSKVDVLTDGGPVRVVNVHAVAPLAAERIPLWKKQLRVLSRITPPAGGHLVLAGDFNASQQNPAFAPLLRNGLRDAFVEAGRGFGFTWPSDRTLIPGVMRIDHLLISDKIVVTRIDRTRTSGSDHQGLVADLALPGPG
jgi:endonuclease/exonuclease/phosphatase (EEP) superfamily protein YafD